MQDVLFPFQKVREIQQDMISDIAKALSLKKHIIMHAPTGIGKTVSVLAPALSHAIKNNLTIFFLTSRQTQHRIVIDTLKQIKQKFGIELEASDIIGKKGMCLQGEVQSLPSGSFHEFCKSLREENKCDFYSNTRAQNNNPTILAKSVADSLRIIGPCHVHEVIDKGRTNSLCPYELAVISAGNAKVVVADYYYMFNPAIRDSFLLKIKKDLDKIIVVVDEAHNLPSRIRELLSQKLSSLSLELAKKEAERFSNEQTIKNLEIVENAIFSISKDIESESIVNKLDFFDAVNEKKAYDEVMAELIFTGESIRDLQKRSFVLSVGRFMESWLGSDIGYGRIVSKHMDKKLRVDLTYRCLDPSLAAKDVIQRSYATILMSGTLTPTSMYKDLLGFSDNVVEKEYKSPFPKKNRLNLVIPRTTTKFAERNPKQYIEIARICNEIISAVPGNCAFFFPSYDFMMTVYERMKGECKKPVFMEKQGMAKHEKEQMLNSFKGYKDFDEVKKDTLSRFMEKSKRQDTAVLFGISTGSFGEGIDMPGVLSAVTIVGLPLQKPDAESKLLIEYYDDKYSRGMEYGYIMPAITKCLQNAGRCIRTEHDKGAIIFLDERYATQSYSALFPEEWDVEVEMDFESALKKFFK